MTSMKVLVVGGAGGGGSGNAGHGGGGAGGFQYDAALEVGVGSYAVTVGAGGAGATGSNGGSDGADSVFSTITGEGGGGGGGYLTAEGNDGGSGGGSSYEGNTSLGTVGQGNNGGEAHSYATAYGGAGGGGSSAVGANANSGNGNGGVGGAGTANSISGSSVTYSGGGGGGTRGGTAGGGGAGGGGAGSNTSSTAGVGGTANLGGGGGGGGDNAPGNASDGGAGGSGVVIIRYATASTESASGGTITTDGADTIHTFNSTGTFSYGLSLPANGDIPQNGSLIARWKLDEESGTRADSVASLDLTDNNTVLYSATPQFGENAADFESANTEYLSHADNDALGMSNGNSSWAFWWKWETSTTMGFFTHWSGTSQRGYGVWYTAGNLRFTYSTTGSNQIDKLFAFTPTLETWYHIVCTYNSGTGTTNYYVNGASIGAPQTGTTGSLYNNTQTFYLGDSGAVFGKLDGAMQDTMMWDAELTAAEVEDLYNAYFNLPDKGDLPQSASVVSRWTLTEDGGQRNDQVGTNHLTDNNTVLSGVGIMEVSTAERSADFEAGNSEYLSIADNASLSITGDLSFACWYKFESSSTTAYCVIMSKTAASPNTGYAIRFAGDSDILEFFGSTNGTSNADIYATTSWLPTEGIWYHIGVVYDASAQECKFYLNGAQLGATVTGLTGTAMYDNAAAFYLGRENTRYSDGLMQDAVLWNAELTAAEVLTLYELYTVAPSTFTPHFALVM